MASLPTSTHVRRFTYIHYRPGINTIFPAPLTKNATFKYHRLQAAEGVHAGQGLQHPLLCMYMYPSTCMHRWMCIRWSTLISIDKQMLLTALHPHNPLGLQQTGTLARSARRRTLRKAGHISLKTQHIRTSVRWSACHSQSVSGELQIA